MDAVLSTLLRRFYCRSRFGNNTHECQVEEKPTDDHQSVYDSITPSVRQSVRTDEDFQISDLKVKEIAPFFLTHVLHYEWKKN